MNFCAKYKMKMMVVLILIIALVVVYANYRLSVTETISDNSVKLPIIMYHHFLKDSRAWGKYVVSPDDFEIDLVYILKKGYTTVDIQDLIDYTYNGAPLPDKPIMLTFDDGYLTQKEYILPILKKYNCKAVVSIVGYYTDKYTDIEDRKLSYAHLNWDDVKELVNSEYIEIQNHSYNMHKISDRKGVQKKIGESFENYQKALNNDIMYMQDLIEKETGYRPYCFTYPFGEYCKYSETIIKDMGFYASLSCAEGINYITGNKDDLYCLKRYNRPAKINREKFFDRFD